jgi:prevent-host-death family protein
MMSSLPVNDAQNNLQEIIDEVVEQGKPVIIRGDRGNAILLAEKDWSAIQETLYRKIGSKAPSFYDGFLLIDLDNSRTSSRSTSV